jgi:hypothetical protein
MPSCLLCNSKKIAFSHESNKGIRNLKCIDCEFIFIDSDEKLLQNKDKLKKNYDFIDYSTSFAELSQHLDAYVSGDVFNAKFIIFSLSNLNKHKFNFYFPKKQNLVKLLHDRNFTNIKITSEDGLFNVSGTKRSGVNKLKLSIIVPVYNESSTCKNTIDSLLSLNLPDLDIELIIVESNSKDGSREIVQQYSLHPSIKIIFQNYALGKGNAVREALNYVTGDFISIHDADDEYSVRDYKFLVSPLIFGSTSFVLGNRHFRSWTKIRTFDDQPIRAFLLNIGHIFFTKLINLVTRAKLRDPFSMYKLIRRDILGAVRLESNRFDLDHEIVIKLCKLGFYPLEIPICYHSRSFKEGKKVNFISDPLNWIVAILRYGFFNKK